MLVYAVFEIAVILPVAALVFGPAPAASGMAAALAPGRAAPVLGLRPRTVQILLCVAGFLCCVPMAMPQGHLVAFCSDLGLPAAHGAAMLSLLLGCAFFSRIGWGFVADRIGGLRTVLAGSVCQVMAMTGFLLTQEEAGLFAVAAIFGLGFSGIIPAYVVAIRELFPAVEASWRIPTLLLFSGTGMAAGGWLAGAIYDFAGILRCSLRHRDRVQSRPYRDHRLARAAAPPSCAAGCASVQREWELSGDIGCRISQCVGSGAARSKSRPWVSAAPRLAAAASR